VKIKGGGRMLRQKGPKRSIEKHTSAAWANVEKTRQRANIPQPSLFHTMNAKEYVDENEK
jgi:hypothetical protein